MRPPLTVPLTISLLAATLLAAAPSVAADYSVRGLRIGHPWSRPAAQGLTGVAYLTITNTNAAPEVLKAVETPAAKRATIHKSTVTSGVASMRALSGGLAIPAGATVRLAPGGDHVMLMELNRALVQGGRIPVTLVFQRAGRVQIELTVDGGAGAAAASAEVHVH